MGCFLWKCLYILYFPKFSAYFLSISPDFKAVEVWEKSTFLGVDFYYCEYVAIITIQIFLFLKALSLA